MNLKRISCMNNTMSYYSYLYSYSNSTKCSSYINLDKKKKRLSFKYIFNIQLILYKRLVMPQKPHLSVQ